MTEKLYDQDAEMQSAYVTVVRQGIDGKGAYAVLDKTIFYPEGGGQPADTGFLDETEVTDVQTAEGEIRHYIRGALKDGEVLAEINWPRRWDHMQQHAGQHLLSAVFEDEFGMKTVSFHLGEERSSIDLETADVSAEVLGEAERLANLLIRQALPITTEWVSKEEAATRELRKAPVVTGDVRLVTIDGVDVNPCGGTHPSNSSYIGLLKIVGAEKAKGGVRIYFLCGERADAYFDELHKTAGTLTRLLNAPVPDLAEAAAALLQEKVEKDKELGQLQKNMLELEAQALQPDGPFLFRNFGDRPFKEVQLLAKKAAGLHPENYVLFVTEEDGRIRFAIGKGEQAAGDVREVLKVLLELTDGKGGGSAEFAQGAGISLPIEKIFEAGEEVFRKISAEV